MKKGGRGVRERFEEATLLALKMQEGAMSRGTWAASEADPLSQSAPSVSHFIT